MTNSSAHFLIYSTNDISQNFNDGPMWTVGLKSMTKDETNKAADKTIKSIDLVKGMIEAGKYRFDMTNENQALIKNGLEVFSGVGDILKGFGKFVPGTPDPLVDELENLKKTVEQLGDVLKENFDQLKAFITKVTCFADTLSPASVLLRFMRDCIKCPGPESRNNFQAAYKKQTPLHMAYDLMDYLNDSSTNPLKTEMDAEDIKKKSTFQKWENIICRVLFQFALLEAFAVGILGIDNSDSVDNILQESYKIYSKMNDWKQDYIKGNKKYWNEVKDIPTEILEDQDLSNSEKADILQKKVDDYLTDNSFYIIVFDHKHSDIGNRLWSKNKIGNDQLITRENCNGTSAFIYCSKLANSVDLEKVEDVRRKCQSYKSDEYRGTILKDELTENPIPNAGFMLLIGGLNEEIRWANFDRREDGPGWWTYSYPWGGSVELNLLAGYK